MDIGGLHYIHARIDALIKQTAVEIGLIRLHIGLDTGDTATEDNRAMALTRARLWAAQNDAADHHKQRHRGP
jgi:hypothetical protein